MYILGPTPDLLEQELGAVGEGTEVRNPGFNKPCRRIWCRWTTEVGSKNVTLKQTRGKHGWRVARELVSSTEPLQRYAEEWALPAGSLRFCYPLRHCFWGESQKATGYLLCCGDISRRLVLHSLLTHVWGVLGEVVGETFLRLGYIRTCLWPPTVLSPAKLT